MSLQAFIEDAQPFFTLVRSLLECMNGFIYPILAIFGFSLTLGLAFYLMHRL